MLDSDGVRSEKELLIREMLFGDIENLLPRYPREILRETFLENIHRFDRRNTAFWKLVLDVSDEELEQKTHNNLTSSPLRKPI